MLSSCLILLLLIYNAFSPKFFSKKYSLILLEANNIKIVFILLLKRITFYMQITIVKIRVLRFKQLIKIISFWLISSLFNLTFYQLAEKYYKSRSISQLLMIY